MKVIDVLTLTCKHLHTLIHIGRGRRGMGRRKGRKNRGKPPKSIRKTISNQIKQSALGITK